jgi:hypothetical protein
MTTGIKLYHRCPFCPTRHGDMAVDTDRIIDWLLENRRMPYRGMSTDHDVHPAGHTLVFNPDFPRGLPCDHLLIASYNSMLFDAKCVDDCAINDATIDYCQSWFKSHERGPELHSCVLDGFGDEMGFNDRFGDRRDSWVHQRMAVTERNNQVLLLHVSGFAIYVERPDDFFRELPRCYELWTNDGVSPESARDIV